MNFSRLLNLLKKSFGYGSHIQPTRDWFVLLTVAVLFLAMSVYWNVNLFVSLESGRELGTAATAPAPAATASITSVQTVFQKRAAQESNYQHAYTFIDPSLGGS